MTGDERAEGSESRPAGHASTTAAAASQGIPEGVGPAARAAAGAVDPSGPDGASDRPAGADPVPGGAGFRVVDEHTVWTGRRTSIATAVVEGPGGERLDRDVLHHPGAVATVPLHDDGTVTLVRQYRSALDRVIWEIPAGLRDVDGEPTVLTAQRELAEEAGLAAAELRHVATFNNSPGFSDEAVVIYLATGLRAVPDDRQGPEEQHMVVERIPLEDAVAMAVDGRITDAKTVIGLLLVARERGEPR